MRKCIRSVSLINHVAGQRDQAEQQWKNVNYSFYIHIENGFND